MEEDYKNGVSMNYNTCERCGQEYLRSVGNQRFCNRACSDAFYMEERRTAVKAYRSAKREPVSYHQIGIADAVAEAGGQGRFARVTPVAVTGASPSLGLASPSWSRDPTGTEPPHDGREEGSVYGLDVSGVGGGDGATLETDDDV